MATNSGPLIAIVGQTGTGKSALAMKLAGRFNGEIICADARTVYKGMDIGTAKPSAADQAAIPHHLLDVVTPDQRFTVVDFKRLAEEAINDVLGRSKLPILVGGSGLYVDAVLYDYEFAPAAAARDPQNPRHLHPDQPSKRSELRSNTLILGLEISKEQLEQRLTVRAEQIMAAGLIEEVKRLINLYGEDIPAFATTSYKPIIEYLHGSLSLQEAVAQFIRNDLQYAKRQKTWFSRNKSIHWLDDPSKAVDIATTFLNKTGL